MDGKLEAASTVLIVDDNPAMRESLAELLLGNGYRLEFAADGVEALQKAGSLYPDAILLDVMMPGVDGFEVCRRLRSDPKLAEVPVIMITALDDRTSRLDGLSAGADDFLSKPFDPAELQIRLKTILRLNRYRRLLSERARFDLLTQLSPDGLVIADAEGIVHFANDALDRLLAAEAAIVGRPLLGVIAEDRGQAFAGWLSTLLGSEESGSLHQSELVRADGRRVPVECSAGRIEWSGRPMLQILFRDVTEREQARQALEQRNRELAQHRDELSALSLRLTEVQEVERRELANELHDSVGQELAVLGLSLNILDLQLREAANPAVMQRLGDALTQVEGITKRIRNVTADLRPPGLENHGLLAALRWQGQDFARRTGIDAIVTGDEPAPRLPAAVETACFRAAQEILTNVARHAQATQVEVDLRITETGVRLTIADDGLGFDPTESSQRQDRPRWGLITMRERILAVGGRLDLVTAPGEGTRVTIEVVRH